MRAVTSPLLLLLMTCAAWGAQPPAPAGQNAPQGLKSWRTSGRFTYIWGPQTNWAKVTKFTLDGRIPLEVRNWIPTGSHYSLAVHVPENVPAGNYLIQPGAIPFEVTAPPAAREEVRVADGDVAALRAAVAAGKDVRLSPGEYILAEPLQLAPGASLRGTSRDAVRIVGRADVVFIPAPGATVRHVTIEATSHHFHRGDWANGELTDCRLVNGHWGEGKREGLLVRDVIFDRCGAMQVLDRVLFQRCRFQGLNSHGQHAWTTWGARNIAMIDSEFDGTDRGIVIQGAWGRVEDCLFDHVSFRNIDRVENGNEVVLFENVDARNNIFSRIRVRDCASDAINIWESDATGNIFSDLVFDGASIRVFSSKPKTVANNTFRAGEIRGGWVNLGQYARNNSLIGLAFVSPRPSRQNQVESFDRGWYVPRAVIYAHRSNTTENCIAVDLPEGWESITHWGDQATKP